jgi:hypothetical protein
MCMDVGPDGFIMPKRPDRGNEAGDLGISKCRLRRLGEQDIEDKRY